MTMLAAQLNAFLPEHQPRDRTTSPHTCEACAYAFQLLVCLPPIASASERSGLRSSSGGTAWSRIPRARKG